ncbi:MULTISPECIES: MerR family transcriptional regulator [unclassified Sporosarcina]|uniref:MerR family transcriptional regulator n=1 Tax=unclassified Sporosarcina TaxID=2647733 RepID=UPI00164DBC78|nr:MerR family transcriptional regulator [Sporosarcina sp. resist]QNK89905.1 MerR family transcriptional regulator [Sporosarcina sp. resist]
MNIITPADSNGLYFIQQVSDMTGLSKQVIRKWEERYNLVQPNRLENGYRIYSEADINSLLNVKTLSGQGHSIKRAVELTKDRRKLLDTVPDPIHAIQHQKLLNDYVFQLLEKGSYCDELELYLVLQQAYHSFGLNDFLTSVIVPFLNEVGNKWHMKEWSEYQESVSSLVVRDFLVQIRRNYQSSDDAPLVLGACLPYERHEIPLHILLLQFMMKGWKTVLVGTSPAPGAIESLVEKLKPAKVLLSATTTAPFINDPDLLESLDQFAANNKHIDFYLGGMGALDYATNKTLQAIHVTSSLEEALRQ